MTETHRIRAGDLTLWPPKLDEWRFAADLFTAVRPDDPQDPKEYAHAWRNPDTKGVIERFIGELSISTR